MIRVAGLDMWMCSIEFAGITGITVTSFGSIAILISHPARTRIFKVNMEATVSLSSSQLGGSGGEAHSIPDIARGRYEAIPK